MQFYFTRVFYFFLAILAVASAAPNHKPSATTSAAPPSQTCSTGPVQCCQTVESAKNAGFLLELLGIVLKDLDILVGLTCSPIEIIGLGGSECRSNVVCCENNSFGEYLPCYYVLLNVINMRIIGGLISIGCIPIIL